MNANERNARAVLFLGPFVAAVVGACLVACFPPHNLIDYWPTVGFVSLGFGTAGLLLGFLASLRLRNRIPSTVAFAAVLIPASAVAWLVHGKSGDWDAAWLFGVGGFISALFFLVRSIDLISNRSENDR